jgi:hypothetical protein
VKSDLVYPVVATAREKKILPIPQNPTGVGRRAIIKTLVLILSKIVSTEH